MKSLVVLLFLAIGVPMAHGNINCPSNKVIIKPLSTDGPLAVHPSYLNKGTLVAPKKGSDSDLYTWEVKKRYGNYAFKNLKSGKWLRALDWMADWFGSGKGKWTVFADTKKLIPCVNCWENFKYAGGDCNGKYPGTFALQTAHLYYFQIKQRTEGGKKVYKTYQDKWSCIPETRFTFECVE